MGWEKRNNNWYYYRKRRENGRVVSEYVGSGHVAELIALLDEVSRVIREEQQLQWQMRRDADVSVDRRLLEMGRLVRMVHKATMIASGYHTHRRQWRRSHHESA